MIDGREMVTTEKLQDEENGIVKFAAKGQGTVEPVGVADGLSRTLPGGKNGSMTASGRRCKGCLRPATWSPGRRPGRGREKLAAG